MKEIHVVSLPQGAKNVYINGYGDAICYNHADIAVQSVFKCSEQLNKYTDKNKKM